MISLMAPTLAEISGHWVHIPSKDSTPFLLSWVSSAFRAILTRICAKSMGKVLGDLFNQALMKFKHWNLSLATFVDLNSLSMRKPMTTWIFLSRITGAMALDIFRIFLRTLMQLSLKDLSLSLSNSNFLNLLYISFWVNNLFRTFLMVFLFRSLEFRAFNCYKAFNIGNLTISPSMIS